MNDFLAARAQMGLSLGFHIIFSCIGMVMPFLMAAAHYRYLKTREKRYKDVTIAWSRGVAIFFATGAVSGTVLSFELGLLWPVFMKHAGPIFGMPFSLEGTAFFIEAIALGFYLYGWGKFNFWFHWLTGVIVGISGLLSGILVVAANAWMNAPAGFTYKEGVYSNIDPIAAMFNKAWLSQALHMSIAAFAATGFAVAGVHAVMLLKRKNISFHITAFKIAAVMACTAALVQPLSGDFSAKNVAKRQPEKLAAMESNFKTVRRAPLILGGVPDESTSTVKYAIKIPAGLSYMAYGDANAVVKGLDDYKTGDRPPVMVTHFAFQIMVGLGLVMMVTGVIYFITLIKRRKGVPRKLLWLFAVLTPAGFMAVEAGWTVTEVGRQPWIIYHIMRTESAVTPMPGIQYSFYLFTAIYVSLSAMVIFLLYRQIENVGNIINKGD